MADATNAHHLKKADVPCTRCIHPLHVGSPSNVALVAHGRWSFIVKRDCMGKAKWCSGHYVLLISVSAVGLLVRSHVGVFFVIHMTLAPASSSASAPPSTPSALTASQIEALAPPLGFTGNHCGKE